MGPQGMTKGHGGMMHGIMNERLAAGAAASVASVASAAGAAGVAGLQAHSTECLGGAAVG